MAPCPYVSKLKDMRKYFETSSIIKCDQDKGDKNFVGFN